jgi:hypothetical protein
MMAPATAGASSGELILEEGCEAIAVGECLVIPIDGY